MQLQRTFVGTDVAKSTDVMGTSLSNLQRGSRIVQVFVRHGFFALLDPMRSGETNAAARLGQRLARVLEDLGPTFVKLGQILSTREDLLPSAIARELSVLQDSARPISAQLARAEIERALGKPIHSLFAAFDDAPIGAGSIAQVHRARTLAGEEVVVKVRRPDIERVLEADLELLMSIARMLEARIPEVRRHDPVGLAEEFGRSLRAELDLAQEARSTERMRKVLGRDANVPRVFEATSTKCVLTLEYVEGKKLSTLRDPEASRRAAKRLVGAFATQLLTGDLFHADPHAGNIVQRGDGSLYLLDLGAVGELTPSMRRVLRNLSVAAIRRDAASLSRAALSLTYASADLDQAAYQRDMQRVLDPLLKQPLGEIDITAVSNELLGLARRHGLRLRPEYFLLFRALTLVDGALRSLDPDIDPISATAGYILRHAYRPRWMGPALALLALKASQRVILLARAAASHRVVRMLRGATLPRLP